MTEPSPALTRFVALIVMTAVFAGLWANDGPADSARLSARKNGAKPATASVATTAAPRAQGMSMQYLGAVKTLDVESAHLNLSEQELAEHIGQLPMGLPVGNYRIVDSQGGVGWLRIRMSDSSQGIELSAVSPLISTSVGNEQVRFIKVREAQTADASARITR